MNNPIIPLRHIIWDAGGTLFDTYPATTAAFLAALDERGISAPAAHWVLFGFLLLLVVSVVLALVSFLLQLALESEEQ